MTVNPDVVLLVTIFAVVAVTLFRAGDGTRRLTVTDSVILLVLALMVWAGAF